MENRDDELSTELREFLGELAELQGELERLGSRFTIYKDAVSEILNSPTNLGDDGSLVIHVPREVWQRFQNQMKRILEI
jgi:hypothetical protein